MSVLGYNFFVTAFPMPDLIVELVIHLFQFFYSQFEFLPLFGVVHSLGYDIPMNGIINQAGSGSDQTILLRAEDRSNILFA